MDKSSFAVTGLLANAVARSITPLSVKLLAARYRLSKRDIDGTEAASACIPESVMSLLFRLSTVNIRDLAKALARISSVKSFNPVADKFKLMSIDLSSTEAKDVNPHSPF